MISLYSGTPGSGKSYHATQRCYDALRWAGANVIANFPIDLTKIKKRKGVFTYRKNQELTVKYLIDFAKEHHKPRKESQTLLIIDEAGIKFNARQWQDKDRLDWLDFFSQHRKFGYEIILISQADLMIDKQIRSFIEIEHIHRSMRHNGKVGFILSPIFTFVDIKVWYCQRVKLGMDFIRYSKKVANIYDSYMLFNESEEK